MTVSEISPLVLYAGGAAAGAAGGLVAARLAERLPARHAITPLASPAARARRNVALVVLAAACGAGLAHVVAGHPDETLARAGWFFGVSLVFVVALLAGSAVDLEHMVLPNELTLGPAAFALATAYFRSVGIVGALVGAIVGFAASTLPHLLYKYLRRRSGQGLGDTKLVIMAGAWLGWEGALFVLFAGALQSALAALSMQALGWTYPVPASVKKEVEDLRAAAAKGDEDAKDVLADEMMAGAGAGAGAGADAGEPHTLLTTRLPLGPFLAAACLEFLFAKKPLLELFVHFVAPR